MAETEQRLGKKMSTVFATLPNEIKREINGHLAGKLAVDAKRDCINELIELQSIINAVFSVINLKKKKKIPPLNGETMACVLNYIKRGNGDETKLEFWEDLFDWVVEHQFIADYGDCMCHTYLRSKPDTFLKILFKMR